MMDVVPKRERGKWNSLEGVSSFTWTGSAALGGYLVDRYSYHFTFRITAGIYVLGTALLLLLVPLTWGEVVPGAGDDAAAAATAAGADGGDDDGGSGGNDDDGEALGRPLLASAQ
jgi:hypothetical protein